MEARPKGARRVLLAVVVVAALALIVVVLWPVPQWQVPEGVTDMAERSQLEDQFRRTIAQIVGGAVLLLGVAAALWRAWAMEKTVEVSRESQITERFTRAVEQLGSDNTAVCLGGIYALERIAKDSPRNDHRQVMEVLTAYVRENARWEEDEGGDDKKAEDRGEPPPLPANIQAILTVLGRRDTYHEEEGFELDLSHTDIRRAELRGAHLERALLTRAHLERAFLETAHLEEAWLNGAHLEEAWLSRARLERASLSEAHLEKAMLSGAHLEGANLFNVYAEKVSLGNAHLEDADFVGAVLQKASLFNAHLERASFNEAQLEGASLYGAYLEGASLRETHLEGADLTGAKGLTKAQIEEAITDEHTRLPDYLRIDETQDDSSTGSAEDSG